MTRSNPLRSARELLEELNAVDESTGIEAKSGSGVGKAILETVSAFSNEPNLGGGHLLLGVAKDPTAAEGREYQVVGVEDPDRVQADLASLCASNLNAAVRPQMAVEQLEGKSVIVVHVPEAPPGDKPVYIRSRGLPRGAFRRIGSTDQSCSDEDLGVLYSNTSVETFDFSIVQDSDINDLSNDAMDDYRSMRARAHPDAEELSWSREDFLRAIGAVRPATDALRPTVTGILLFGTPTALRRCFPMMRIDYIRVHGKEWVSDPDGRFETLEIRAPLLAAVSQAIRVVTDDLLRTFVLPDNQIQSRREFELPARVVREAIVNAVMHRSYRIHSPIQILRYSNRLEIRNPGYSLKPEEALGEPGSEARNPRIAAALHDVNIAETKGSGIRVMRKVMRENGLMPPTFESSRNPSEFKAYLLLHNLLEERDVAWARALSRERLSHEDILALVFVREVGAIDNVSYRDISGLDTLAASGRLRRLCDLGLLEKRGAGSRTHYVPGSAFSSVGREDQENTAGHHRSKNPGPADPHQVKADPHQAEADPHQVKADPHQVKADPHQVTVGSERHGMDPLSEKLPASLRRRLPRPGSRPRRQQLRELIVELCSWQPLSSEELAFLLGDRDKKTLVREHLSPMVDAGEIRHTIPNMVNHPDQKYAAAES